MDPRDMLWALARQGQVSITRRADHPDARPIPADERYWCSFALSPNHSHGALGEFGATPADALERVYEKRRVVLQRESSNADAELLRFLNPSPEKEPM